MQTLKIRHPSQEETSENSPPPCFFFFFASENIRHSTIMRLHLLKILPSNTGVASDGGGGQQEMAIFSIYHFLGTGTLKKISLMEHLCPIIVVI